MSKRVNKRCLHPKQIPTTYETIKRAAWYWGYSALGLIMRSFEYEQDSEEYKNCIVMAAVLFEKISCLVYAKHRFGGYKGYYQKPDEKMYRYHIFEGPAETVEEVSHLLAASGWYTADPAHVHKVIWQVADLVCTMMACEVEQAFVSEYAYTIDYVIKHRGNLPKPEMCVLFPKNYNDFKYLEGIGEEAAKYE